MTPGSISDSQQRNIYSDTPKTCQPRLNNFKTLANYPVSFQMYWRLETSKPLYDPSLFSKEVRKS
jgi:hypothetical protein